MTLAHSQGDDTSLCPNPNPKPHALVRACRYHIAVPWFIGGALLLVLPVAWMHKADEVSYALLVLASLGIMSSDGELKRASTSKP
mgnify:CR=1 FL=1